MSSTSDLLLLVADQDMEFALNGLLRRDQALGIRRFTWKILRHPGRDPGCRTNADEFLRPFANQYQHALVIFDHDGSGAETETSEYLENALKSRLASCGWTDRAAAIVVDPELEIWVFSDSPEVDRVMGWQARTPGLRDWLVAEHYLEQGEIKPRDPKLALARALRHVQKKPSASLFEDLAASVSIQRCQDPSFARLLAILHGWFGVAST